MNKHNISFFDLKLGYKCNCNCVHCFIADRRDTLDLTTEEIKKIIDNNINKRTLVTVTGGEPTIRDDIIEILKYIKSKKCSVLLQTNGLRFSDPKFTKTASKYIDKVVFTLHSHIPEIHNKIVNSHEYGNAFEIAIQGIENLKMNKATIDTQTVITKYNLPYLVETYDFIKTILPTSIMRLTFPHPVGNAKLLKELVPSYTEAGPAIKSILEKWYDYIVTTYIPLCYIYPYHDVRYHINHHDEFSSGEIEDKGFDRSIDDGKFVKDNIISSYTNVIINGKVKAKECNQCIFNNRCVGIWKEYQELFGYLDVAPIVETEKIKKDFKHKLYKNIIINDIESANKISIEENEVVIIETQVSNIKDINNIITILDCISKFKNSIKKYVVTIKNNDAIPVKNLGKILNDCDLVMKVSSHHSGIKVELNDAPFCIVENGYRDFIVNNNPNKKKEKIYFDECEMCNLRTRCDGIYKSNYELYGKGDLKKIK